MFEPPSGEADLEADTEDASPEPTRYRDLYVESAKLTVKARRPTPRACHAVAMAANSKIGAAMQADHLTLFIRHHLDDESYTAILSGMLTGDLPADAMQEVARSLATWGTARPTVR